MEIELKFKLNLADLICLPQKGSQGYNVVISPRLGKEILGKEMATVLSDALNEIFSQTEIKERHIE